LQQQLEKYREAVTNICVLFVGGIADFLISLPKIEDKVVTDHQHDDVVTKRSMPKHTRFANVPVERATTMEKEAEVSAVVKEDKSKKWKAVDRVKGVAEATKKMVKMTESTFVDAAHSVEDGSKNMFKETALPDFGTKLDIKSVE
jgi:hypothetical protein